MAVSEQRLGQIAARFAELEARLASGTLEGAEFVAASRDYAELEPVAKAADQVRAMRAEMASLAALNDPEMRELAEEELARLKAELPQAEHALAIAMLPRDSADSRPAMLEIRAGTGGDEAALFAADLYRMYERFAAERGWRIELVSANASDVGGFKEVVANVTGNGVFARLKFESGVHRVQRVPVTESGGRIHTSAATVAVLPEPDEVDVQVNDSDIKIDIYRASGAGGQHVNTTDSAVRITHVPSGIIVASQIDRSQHKNREIAMNMLKARMYEAEMQKREEAASAEHAAKTDIGWGHQIRSYVLQPYQMVKDLRTGVTSPTPSDVLDGAVDPFMAAALAQRVTGEKVVVEDVD